mmetsp:Transcript_29456/g.70836  ORF Transcript_29456/g.70836 Transcript_29456/m.70836 type:complete len:284 (-) Transcript_29456:325-1176(-)
MRHELFQLLLREPDQALRPLFKLCVWLPAEANGHQEGLRDGPTVVVLLGQSLLILKPARCAPHDPQRIHRQPPLCLCLLLLLFLFLVFRRGCLPGRLREPLLERQPHSSRALHARERELLLAPQARPVVRRGCSIGAQRRAADRSAPDTVGQRHGRHLALLELRVEVDDARVVDPARREPCHVPCFLLRDPRVPFHARVLVHAHTPRRHRLCSLLPPVRHSRQTQPVVPRLRDSDNARAEVNIHHHHRHVDPLLDDAAEDLKGLGQLLRGPRDAAAETCQDAL